ncbi:hypothetical protein BDY19DRAFT_459392 [Irpex rosettiformis]|uniref:Uncharacterized protein n=1 Tax=Irpex rosettiformis TaxID=378272 RepID=A0ACB8TT00_9APHY|nr:hypothetical protein BDY19DRAFT_459392 [Irpex rosettiformis]
MHCFPLENAALRCNISGIVGISLFYASLIWRAHPVFLRIRTLPRPKLLDTRLFCFFFAAAASLLSWSSYLTFPGDKQIAAIPNSQARHPGCHFQTRDDV